MSPPDKPILRFDITTNDWVLFAPARARRPGGHRPPSFAEPADPCPFCPGNEALTEEVLREPENPAAPWNVRVIRNKYPALEATAFSAPKVLGPLFREMGGYGVHEVIIESPDHSRMLAKQPARQIERLLGVLHGRVRDLMEDGKIRAIVIFKNQGERAGTSLTHPHFQLVATPVVPRLLRIKHMIATDYFDHTGTSLYRVALDEELASGERLLASNQHYVAALPFASHLPYQIRILPRFPRAAFSSVPLPELSSLAELVKEVLMRLALGADNPDFNLTLNTAPIGDEDEPYFAWHIDVLPRITTPAGFELGSGMAINPVTPEDAAATLRAVELPYEELAARPTPGHSQ